MNTRKQKIQDDEQDYNGIQDKRPLGCDCAEHDHHYLTCTAQSGLKEIRRETRSLDKSLTKTGTHPDLQRVLIQVN